MYSFDASSMIHAWDNYPPENEHFESLWEWFSSNVQNKEFVISKKAFKEVSDKIPECREWLQNSNVEIYSLTSTSLLIAKDIKASLNILEDKYTKGVGENDLFIIAIAQESGATLVSEEGRQSVLPTPIMNCLTALNPCRPSIYRFYSKRQNQHAGQQPATS